MVSLFLAHHGQYFMFQDSNVFEFTNFSFKMKYNNTVVYSVNSIYLFSKGKQEKTRKARGFKFLRLNCSDITLVT